MRRRRMGETIQQIHSFERELASWQRGNAGSGHVHLRAVLDIQGERSWKYWDLRSCICGKERCSLGRVMVSILRLRFWICIAWRHVKSYSAARLLMLYLISGASGYKSYLFGPSSGFRLFLAHPFVPLSPLSTSTATPILIHLHTSVYPSKHAASISTKETIAKAYLALD